MRSIIFVGFMGAGKTTVGSLLSKRLNKKFIDFDEYLVDELQMSIADFFSKYGEEEFRKRESALLIRLKDEDAIISTGGGIVVKEANRTLLKDFFPAIYLKANGEVLLKRLLEDDVHVRPLIIEKNTDHIIQLFESREAFYEEVASFTIDTSLKTPEEIMDEIIDRVGE